MKKQNYLVLIIGAIASAALIAGCSAASVNTAANVSNKTNANVAMANANRVNANNMNVATTP